MSSIVHDPTQGMTATPLADSSKLTQGVVSSTPLNEIDSSTFLQQQTFTGMQFDVPLPFGAVNGFQPMFAIRVDPVIRTPHIYNYGANLGRVMTAIADNTNLVSILPRNGSAESYFAFELQPFRLFNGTKMRFTGPEPPQSIFTRMFRFNRIDFVYTVRIVSTYTGGGILMAVPVKGVPRGTTPFTVAGTPQITANANQFNSNLQVDLSRSRQFRFVYPYEYPTEYQDLTEDHARWYAYVPDLSDTNARNNAKGIPQFDNWFVIGTRGSIITPTNADKLTFYIDYSFSQYDLNTPILPIWRAIQPTIPILTDGTNTAFFEYTEQNFRDSSQTVISTSVMTNSTGAIVYGTWTIDGGTYTKFTVAVNATYTLENGRSYCFGTSDFSDGNQSNYARIIALGAKTTGFTLTLGTVAVVIPNSTTNLVYTSAVYGPSVLTKV